MIEHQWRMYLGFLFGGGGGSKCFFENVGVFAWREARLLIGVQGHASPKKKKNRAIWCDLENILLKFCKKCFGKNS